MGDAVDADPVVGMLAMGLKDVHKDVAPEPHAGYPYGIMWFAGDSFGYGHGFRIGSDYALGVKFVEQSQDQETVQAMDARADWLITNDEILIPSPHRFRLSFVRRTSSVNKTEVDAGIFYRVAGGVYTMQICKA